MTPEQYERIERLFEQAVALPVPDRAAFLDEQCGDDPEVRSKVEAMLARDQSSTVNIERPAGPGGLDVGKVVAGMSGAAAVPDRIGDYRIKSVIASGGMGTVYLAQQDHPRRVVALKIMKPGVASRSALRRFEYESQILARLRHPNIAQVYEAGTHDDGAGGVPYFAMEYVPGAKTLVEHAEQKKLGTRERLALFAKVCDAVHHGHTKGIIHRDLKPGNILVDSTGEPRIIDFGVARATDSDLAVTTLQTDVGQLIGTLQYMSPEQCDADPHDIDTRSDVYALGVVLYELLSGALPYDVSKHAVYDAARVVREEAPAKPSTLDRTLRGDVETITLKAMEKDRDRRYASAEALAEDIGRYLGHQPILARPPSVSYQLRTFARRHTGLVTAAAVVLLVLVGGIVATSVALARALTAESLAEERLVVAERARAEEAEARFAEAEARAEAETARERAVAGEQRALIEAAKSERIAAFTGEMLSGVDPATAGDMDTTLMRMILDDASDRIETELADQPEVEAQIRNVIGNTYVAIGLYPMAEPHLESALETSRRVLGDEHPNTLVCMNGLASLYYSQGRYDEAEPLFVTALEVRRRVLGDEHPNTLVSINNLANLYRSRGRYDEAEPLWITALEVQRRVLGDEHPDTLRSMNSLAGLYYGQGRYDEAEPLSVTTLEVQRRVLGDEHPETLVSTNNLANLYQSQGRYDEAEPLWVTTLGVQRRVLGDEHPDTLKSVNNLAILYARQGRLDEAEPLWVTTLEVRRRVLGDEHPDTLGSMNNLAILYESQGRYDEAEPLSVTTLEVQRRVLGNEHPATLRSMSNLATLYAAQGRDESSRPLVRELLEHSLKMARAPGVTTDTKNTSAWTLLTCEPSDLRDPETALALAIEANDMTRNENPSYLDTLSLAYHLTGDTAKAIENQKKAIALLPPGASDLRTGLEAALAAFEAALAGAEERAD